jgi:methylthioribose-1-phosphate isomerase
MIQLLSAGLRVNNNVFEILDQQLLPSQETWIAVQSPSHMVEIIKALKVRGAPMIGICAAIALAQYAEKTSSIVEIEHAAHELQNARPTAVNLAYCIGKMLATPRQDWQKGALWEAAVKLFHEDITLCESIAKHGIPLLKNGAQLLTICNTGRIATAGIGTALGIAYKAHELGMNIHVNVVETRPLLQGGRLTIWELKKQNVPCTLLIDNAAAALMQKGVVDAVFVGADRIACNGDSANKIGTYSLAVLAAYHRIPFYVVAPYTTVDPLCESGMHIEIEQRSFSEVHGVQGSFGNVTWAESSVQVFNPAFDVTPAELITGIVLDCGYFNQKAIKHGEHLKIEEK